MRRFVPPVRRFVCLAGLFFVLAGGTSAQQSQAPIVDANVNMVRGIKFPDGDPYLQRQNEPSIAVSTRNPCHLVAGANDYRSVDIPFDNTLPPGAENNLSLAGDAWLGLFKSFDCGGKWQSTLLPGYPQDTSGKAPSLQGYAAGADPTVRAGTNGLFYYSGMVFNRGNDGDSKIFVARLIDNNNKERGDPIEFLDVATIDTGTKGQFLDKPWMAVDVPRASFGPGSALASGGAGTAMCTVSGQQIPAGNVYMAWARFTGNSSQHSKLMFARSEDCGKTWKTHPVTNNQTLSQGANIAIAPHDGTIYLTWREFAGNKKPVNMWIAVSSDGGKTFSNPKMIAGDVKTFDQLKSNTTFRSNALPAITADHQNRVYVAWAATGFAWTYGAGGVKLPNLDSRIVMTVSSDRGKTFSPVFAIDPNLPTSTADTGLRRGHQMMPSLTFAAGKIQAIYYDAREDISGVFKTYIDDKDVAPGKLRHTIDVRGAQADPAAQPVFVPAGLDSFQISKYRQLQVDVKDAQGNTVRQSTEVGANPPNLPMYAAASMPFIGDYIDVSGLPSFPILNGNGQQVWQPNIGPLNWAISASAMNTSTIGFPNLPVFHAVWTDNRDVRMVDASVCTPDPSATGERNANIYTSRLTPGLFVGSPGNTKPLGKRLGTEELIQRGFVVFAQNTTDTAKTYQFTIVNQPEGGRASFRQFDKPVLNPDGTPGDITPLTSIKVGVPKGSTSARTLYATSTDEHAQILVNIEELPPTPQPAGWTPLRGSVLLNPDRTNPKILDPDLDEFDPMVPQIAANEVHDPSMFDARFYRYPAGTTSRMLDVKNPDPENPDPENPDPENPDPENPDPENPDPENPDPENTSLINPDPENPDPENPDPENPDPENIGVLNTAISETEVANSTITDISWRVHNSGNTTSAYRFRPSVAKKQPGTKYQLIVTRRYMTMTMGVVQGPNGQVCQPVYKSQNQVITNIQNFQPRTPDPENPDPENPDPENPDPENPDPENPDPENPDPENANFFLSPDETATVTLRVFTPADEEPPTEEKKEEVAGKTAAKAANTGEEAPATTVTGPDLTVSDTAPSFAPAIVRPGRTVNVTFTLTNRGTAAATAASGPIKTRIFLSTNSILDATDTLVGTAIDTVTPLIDCDHATPLDPCSQTYTRPWVAPSPGQYYLFVVADNDLGVFEADELNNTVVIPIRVDPYQLTFTTEPTATTQDFTMAPVAVAVTHPDNGPVTGLDLSITLAIQTNPASGVLSGTVVQDPWATAAGGETDFTDLRINNPGTGYRLLATAPGANGAISAFFNIETDLPPVVGNDSYTVAEDQTLNVATTGVLANDSDPAFKGTKPAADNPRPSPGCPAGFCLDSVILAAPANGQVTLGLDGAFSYTPNPTFNGTDTFTYRARDGRVGNETTGTVTITVTAVNDVPSFTKGADQTVSEDAAAQSIGGWATAISAGPANESGQLVDFIVTNTNNALFSSQPAVSATGTLTYTPAANANGAATVTVRIHDNGGILNGGVDTSAPQTFTVTITAVNDPPSFTKGADQTVAEDSGAQTVPGWASAISAGPADESGQVLTFNVLNPGNSSLFTVQPAISANGTLTYTPAPNANGTANILVQLQDDGGGLNLSAPTSFNITVSAVNDTPSFVKGANQTVAEDAAAQTVTGWATAISAGPANESGQVVDFIVTNTNTSMFSAQPAISAAGTLTYTPASNKNGTSTVTVQLHDNGGGADTSAAQTFTITVTAVNDAPVAVADSYTVAEDTVLGVDASGFNGLQGLLFNDSDPDAGTNLIAVYLTNPTHGTLLPHANGSFSYTPHAHYNGPDSFTYRPHDGTVPGNTVTVSITVTAVNDAPSFLKGADQTVATSSGAHVVPGWATAISAGPADESGQAVNFIVSNTNTSLFATAPAVSPTGTLTYSVQANQTGTATLTIQIHDNGGAPGVDTSAAQTFTISVTEQPQTYVVTNTDDSGPGSLRAALTSANANASVDTVTFDIPGGPVHIIAPQSPLPSIAFGVDIDARTQPGYSGTPVIVLNGATAGAGVSGLTVTGQGVTIRGLAIAQFAANGVRVEGSNNVVELNKLTNNTEAGIYLSATASGTRISQNTIVDNGLLGIDLSPAGVNANDADDADLGANKQQNFPVLTGAFSNNGASTTITGTLTSAANTDFTIEFFVTPAADASGYGEGQAYLGSQAVTTDGSGNAAISIAVGGTTPGAVVTATATDPDGNTSEFSLAQAVVANNPPTATGESQTVTGGGSTTFNPSANDTDPDVPSSTVLATVRATPLGQPVLTSPGDVAVVASTGLAYFTGGNTSAATPGRIGILDTATNTVTGAIAPLTAGGASLVRVNQATSLVYMRRGSSLDVIDGRSGSPNFNMSILTMQLGSINSMAIDEAHGRLYLSVVNSSSGTLPQGRVVVLDINPLSGTFHEIVGEIVAPSTGSSFATVQGIAVNAVTNKVYAAFSGGASPGVNVIDGVNFAVTPVANTTGASTIVVNDANNMVYATSGNLLYAIDGNTNARTAITLPANATAGSIDSRLAVHKGTGRVYVRLAEFPAASRLVVVNGTSIETTLTLGREDGTMVAIDEDANRLITTSRLDLRSTVIDTTNNQVVGSATGILANQGVARIGIDDAHNRAYVSGAVGYLQVIDLVKGVELTRVQVGVQTTFGAVDTVNHVAYMPQTGNTMAVNRIDATGLIGNVALGHGDGVAVGVVRNSATNTLYAVNGGATIAGASEALPGFVHVIDGADHTVKAKVAVGPHPFQGIAVNEVTGKVYVGSQSAGATFPGGITVIDGGLIAPASVTADLSQIPLSSGPTPTLSFAREFVVNPATNKVYVRFSGNSTAQMGVLNGATNVVTALPNTYGAVNHHRVNPVLNRVYIGGINAAGVNEIHVLNGATDQEIAVIAAGSTSPYSNQQSYMAVNKATGRLYVANHLTDTVSVIDGATNAILGTISVGDGPSGVTVNETLNRIYVSNSIDRTLTIIDGAAFRVAATVALPLAPLRTEVDETTSTVYVTATLSEPGTVVVHDAGTSAPPVISVTQGAHGTVTINPDGSVTYTANVGYLGSDSYTYTVSDGRGGTSTGTVNVTVVAPLAITTATLPSGAVGNSYNQAIAVTGGTGVRSWLITAGQLPGGIGLHNATGTLSGTARQSGTFTFTVTVRDSATPPQTVSQNYTLTVGPPVVTTTFLPSGFVNQAYSQQLAVGGATGAVTWTLDTSGNALLSWLSISSGGILSGTPAVSGPTPSFTVTATDAALQSASRTFTLQINGPLNITTTTLNDATAGSAYNGSIFRTDGVSPFNWALSGDVPNGMVLNPTGNTGTFNTTFPANMLRETRQYTFTVTVTDSSSPPQTDSQTYTIRIHATDQTISSSSSAAVALPSTRRVAQVFRSGTPYNLSGVSISTISLGSCTPGTVVTATVRPVTGSPARPDESGAPLATGSATATGGGSLPSAIVPFTSPVAIPQHAPFAIVLSFGPSGSSCQGTNWPTSDFYPHGQAWVNDSDAGWVAASRADLSLATLVMIDDRLQFLTSFRSSGQASALLDDGRVLIVGTDATADLYDPATETATRTANNMVGSRFGASASRLGDGRILIAGGSYFDSGLGFTQARATTEIFDPATGLFSAGPNLPNGGRFRHEATTLNDGKILLSGGLTYDIAGVNSTVSTAVLLDANGAVLGTATMTGARYQHTATPLAAPDTRVLIVGGWTGTPHPATDAEIYDPDTSTGGTFTAISSPLPGGFRAEHTGTLLTTGPRAGQVLIAGGSGSYPDMASENAFFDPDDDTFSAAPGLLTPRWTHTATTLSDGRVMIAGGAISWLGFKSISAVEIYDPMTNQFSGRPNLLVDRSDHAAALLPPEFGGAVAVGGGSGSSNLSARTFEIYSPASPDLAITTSTLPDGRTGQPYPSTGLSIAGGTGPAFTFTIVWGALPTGLSLNNDGTISGMPTVGGLASFTVRVTDSASNTAERTFTIVVNRLVIDSESPLPPGIVNVEYTHQLEASGVGNLTWTLDGIPPSGFSLSSSGLLTGTSNTAQFVNFNVRVTDAAGQVAVKNLSVFIDQPLTITTTSIGDAIAGQTYQACFQATGGSGQKHWSVSSGAPAGVVFANNGDDSCFDTTYPARILRQGGTFTFDVTVTDESDPEQSDSQTVTLKVQAQDQSVSSQGGSPHPALPASRRIAQTFQSGSPFDLTGVQLSGNIFCGANATITATVWPVTGSPARPDESGPGPLGTGTMTTDATGFFNQPHLLFATPIPMPQRAPFAIVLSFTDSNCSGQNWPVDDIYKQGHGWVDDGGGWARTSATLSIARADIPITTLVTPAADLRFMEWRGGHTSATLSDGKILIVGPHTAEIYDPVARTISFTTGAMIHSRHMATATRLLDGKVLIVGGWASSAGPQIAHATTEIFDPQTGTFSAGDTMTTGRFGQVATVLDDGKVLITGGWTLDPGGLNITLETAVLFDAAGEIVANLAMTGARVKHTATLLEDGRVLVVGGWTGSPQPPHVAEIYDPTVGAAGTFTPVLASGSIGGGWPTQHTATRIESGPRSGQVLIAGGQGAYPQLAATGHFFDPGTGTFTAAPGLIQPRLEHTATLLSNDLIAFVGGIENWTDNTPATSVEYYDPDTNAFTVAGDLHVARSQHTTDLILYGPDAGKLAVAGGFGPSSMAGRTVEVFDITNPGAALMLTPQVLADGVSGQSYSTPALTASGGSGIGYNFTLAWGELPDGLTLGNNGTIAGTPTESGPVSFVAKVTDSASHEAYRGFTIVVDRLTITTTSLPNGYVGGAYSFQIQATGAAPIVWALVPGNTLPTGLSLSSSGLLSGTTSAPGGWSFTVHATDATGQSVFAGFFMQVVTTLGNVYNMGNMNAARSGHVAEQLTSGLVLLAGSDDLLTTSAELYNLNGGTTATGSLSVARCYGCASAKLADGKVLVAGGYNGSTLSSAEYYDPSSAAFEFTSSSMTAPRRGANAIKLGNNHVLVLGGLDSSGDEMASFDLYDPASKTFWLTGNMTIPRSKPGVAMLTDGRVLVAGGLRDGHVLTATAEIYDPTNAMFSATGNMVTARQIEQTAVLPDGRVLFAGGSGPNALSAAEVFDPGTSLFSSVGALGTARKNHSVIRLHNGLVLVIGGQDPLGTYLATTELFDPSSNTFTAGPAMSVPRAGAKAILLSNGTVLITGGYTTGDVRTSSVERFVP